MPRTGVVDAELEQIGNLATGKDYHNAARNLHNYLHSNGKNITSVYLVYKTYNPPAKEGWW